VVPRLHDEGWVRELGRHRGDDEAAGRHGTPLCEDLDRGAGHGHGGLAERNEVDAPAGRGIEPSKPALERGAWVNCRRCNGIEL
jgi:hypothetical protein